MNAAEQYDQNNRDDQQPSSAGAKSVKQMFAAIQERARTEKARQEQEEAEQKAKVLVDALAEYRASCPEVVAMCDASGIAISAEAKDGLHIVFSYKSEKVYYRYQQGSGSSLQLTSSWTPHSIETYAQVLYRDLVKPADGIENEDDE
jgi:hypothetical protein